MTTRTARCGCGRVLVTLKGDPVLVGACNCDFCQKRTGSVIGVQAYFSPDQLVETEGETKAYDGLELDGSASQDGRPIEYHFCTTCGSTVYWTVDGRSDTATIGVAVGNFVEPEFPPPTREYYTVLRHSWMRPVPSADQFETFPEQKLL